MAISFDLENKGLFFGTLHRAQRYNEEMSQCISRTVDQLLRVSTTSDRPGMLLGKIQSGKTRTFIGVMAMAFDRGFDVAVVLTKGTRALAQQTLERLKREFRELSQDDQLQIFDIMNLPTNLTFYELDQKMIFVVKKENKNMERLHRAFFDQYPSLSEKRVLIIDDEADFASFGFTKRRDEGVEIRRIAGQIDLFRQNIRNLSFLQVTATPYSLYLQPEDFDGQLPSDIVFRPIRPAFTELVPVHSEYIGGEYYFDESENDKSIASHLFRPVPENELKVLRNPDRRSFKIEQALTSGRVARLREAIVTFIVGACMRRLQSQSVAESPKKFSFIIHTEQNKSSHDWQYRLVCEIKNGLKDGAERQSALFEEFIKEAYENLSKSMAVCAPEIPTIEEVILEVKNSLLRDHLMITVVNSERDVAELLDDTGQLKLRTPLNLFIGGQILDRGITIGNLIGFYYGRNPNKFQQDTVLQHSRMYGARPLQDLAVTRFYTTAKIYGVMKKIHEFDVALREAFENGSHDHGVVFIQKDEANRIVPCSPNKLLLSHTTTLKPSTRLLPVGFKLKPSSQLGRPVAFIDSQLSIFEEPQTKPILLPVERVVQLIRSIEETFAEGSGWDVQAFITGLEYMARRGKGERKDKIWVLVRRNRETRRLKADGRPENSPDSYQEKDLARETAVDIPCLILLRQNGDVEKGWTGHPFWWPILVTPQEARTVIFTNHVAASEDDIAEDEE